MTSDNIWTIPAWVLCNICDKFLINRNTLITYGWAKRGMPGRNKRNTQQFRMSFVVAHSSKRVEEIMGTTTNMNTIKY